MSLGDFFPFLRTLSLFSFTHYVGVCYFCFFFFAHCVGLCACLLCRCVCVVFVFPLCGHVRVLPTVWVCVSFHYHLHAL